MTKEEIEIEAIREALARHNELLYPQDGKSDVLNILAARTLMLNAPTGLGQLLDEIERINSINHTFALTIGEADKRIQQLLDENERLNGELEIAYDAYEKLQKEFDALDTAAAKDCDEVKQLQSDKAIAAEELKKIMKRAEYIQAYGIKEIVCIALEQIEGGKKE